MSQLLAFIVYWLILFVACYAVTEYAQNYLYDETTPAVGPKLLLGTSLLAVLATWLRPSYDTMFTSEIAWTVLQGVGWFLVFMLILGFHPPHALGLGLATMVLAAGMATLAADSLTGDGPTVARREIRPPSKPLRRPAFVPSSAPPADGATPGLPPEKSPLTP